MTVVAGIDVGGTFTDLVLFDTAAGTIRAQFALQCNPARLRIRGGDLRANGSA